SRGKRLRAAAAKRHSSSPSSGSSLENAPHRARMLRHYRLGNDLPTKIFSAAGKKTFGPNDSESPPAGGDTRNSRNAPLLHWTRSGVPDFIANPIKPKEILFLERTARKRKRLMCQRERQLLREPPPLRLKISVDVLCRSQVAGISHAVVG